VARDDAWLRDEPALGAASREVIARALEHPLRLAAVAVAITAAVVAVLAARTPTWVATVVFRMEESRVQDRAYAPPPVIRIREYVEDVALSRGRLLALMDRHGLGGRLRHLDPVAAVESMREDFDVEIVRDYFLFDPVSSEPRSAQVLVSYRGGDRDRTAAIAHEIAMIIVDAQAVARAARLEEAQALSSLALRNSREHLERLEQRRIRLLGGEGAGAHAAEVRAEQLVLEREIRTAAARERQLESRELEARLTRDAEEKRLGLVLELVDESVRAVGAPLHAGALVALATLTLAVALIASGVVLGALDDRIYGSLDVVAAGSPVLGVVPPLRAGAGAAGRPYRAPSPRDEGRP
jgi:hypothetical protein